MFDSDWFKNLDFKLRNAGLDSDSFSFDDILGLLKHKTKLSSDGFALQSVYVILASGFSQKTAKRIFEKISCKLKSEGAEFDDLIKIFNNKNKINAICKIWVNRDEYCHKYYELHNIADRLKYLATLPHIGKITANHLARNLGEDIVKYDIWIQRLGVLFSGDDSLLQKIDNGCLDSKVKFYCDKMFDCLVQETGLPRGYIDVVLWRACQNGFIKDLKK